MRICDLLGSIGRSSKERVPANSSLFLLTITALASFSELISRNCPRVFRGPIYATILAAPIIEETLMRGILQPGIAFVQRKWKKENSIRSEQNESIDRFFRIQITAVVFTVLHIFQPYSSSLNALGNLCWIYSGGLAYGYLSEKTGSIALPILFHGVNNSLGVVMFFCPNPVFLISIVGLRLLLSTYLIIDGISESERETVYQPRLVEAVKD